MRLRLPLAATALALVTTACNPSAERTNDQSINGESAGLDHSDNAMAGAGTANATSAAAQSADAFVATMAGSDLYEIESGQLAQSKATNAALKSFGTMLVTDHQKSTADLKTAAAAASPTVTPPAMLPAEQQAKIDALKAVSGAEFDRLFLQQQKEGHQKALETLRAYAASGDQESLKTFAAKASPVVQRHLDQLNGMQL